MATPNGVSFLIFLLTLNIQTETKKSLSWIYHDKGGVTPSTKLEGTVNEKTRREEEREQGFQHH